ncbi:MAG TPA: hypothetical protein VL379_09925 [Pseudomonadales bacterium]|nr:hypothetical protein [Pseudomonadales bacterium]
MIRRHFGLAAGVLAACGIVYATGGARRNRVYAIEADLRRLFSRPADAAEVGRRYLAAYPTKSSRDVLWADLLETHTACTANASTSEHVFSQWQQRDFRDGTVVQLDGWILARAEVSLCALVHLERWT